MDNSSPVALQNRLKALISSAALPFRPARRGYFPGESVEAEVFGLNGVRLGCETFRIGSSPGSGFAGQVYQAWPQGELFGQDPLAIKVLKPKTLWKSSFRDLLFHLSYQATFSPRVRESALCAGLIWQEILRIAVGLELGLPASIPHAYGYYWDDSLQSFAALHEWVEGRPARFAPDDGLLLRLLWKDTPAPVSEIQAQKVFMDDLVKVCHRIGALGLSRQYEWYTLVSQSNVLVRLAPLHESPQFVGVDTCPGLAVPFFLPLSPVHARLILHGLRRNVLVHFNEVDFSRLDSYLLEHPDSFRPLLPLIDQLKTDDACYRNRLPDLWHSSWTLLHDTVLQQAVCRSLTGDWLRLEKISTQVANELQAASGRWVVFLLLDNLPGIGPLLLRWFGNPPFRRHLRRFLVEPGYRRAALLVQRAADLLNWQATGRVAIEHLASLGSSWWAYWTDKLGLSWLPARLHRLLTDPAARSDAFYRLLVHPVRIAIDPAYRRIWLAQVIALQQKKGILDAKQAAQLEGQIAETRMQAFLRDIGLTIGLEVISKLVYLALAAHGFSTGNFWPLALLALGPIPPSGFIREAYVLAQLLLDLPGIFRRRDRRLLWTRLLGVALAPWRMVGNLFAPLEMFAYYPSMSLLLGEYFVARMVRLIPVLGSPGRLLEYWAFQLSYNLPLSIFRLFAGD